MTLIKLEQISKVYGKGDIAVHALQDVTLSIEEGEFTVLVGPSGSGKTTLFNLIGGLDLPTAGRVSIDDKPLESMSGVELADFRRDHIGFIFQSFNLIPVLTVKENIEYVMLLQGVPAPERAQRVAKALQEVGLAGLEGRLPNQLSGGQQQRVAIARAMVTHPRIILADEPTANIDTHTGIEIIKLMKRLNETENMTFLFSTHDPMVRERASRVIKLRDGMLED